MCAWGRGGVGAWVRWCVGECVCVGGASPGRCVQRPTLVAWTYFLLKVEQSTEVGRDLKTTATHFGLIHTLKFFLKRNKLSTLVKMSTVTHK